MTQDEIIEMYMQVSKELCNDTEWCWAGVGEPLQMFANLVAAKKQERIIEVVERLGTWAHITEVVAEIRGEA
jgi:hypothetical protein